MSFRLFVFALLLGFVAPVGAIVNPAVVNPAASTEAEVLQEVADYKASLQDMSRKERRTLKKDQRKAAKQAMRTAKAHGDVEFALLVVLAIVLPPLAVYLHEGEVNTRFWISLLLSLFFWVPGIIYALIIVLSD